MLGSSDKVEAACFWSRTMESKEMSCRASVFALELAGILAGDEAFGYQRGQINGCGQGPCRADHGDDGGWRMTPAQGPRIGRTDPVEHLFPKCGRWHCAVAREAAGTGCTTWV